MTTNETGIEYRYITLWGIYMSSYQYYIDQEIAAAKADNAPWNAIYRTRKGNGDTSEWVTTASVSNPNARKFLGLDRA